MLDRQRQDLLSMHTEKRRSTYDHRVHALSRHEGERLVDLLWRRRFCDHRRQAGAACAVSDLVQDSEIGGARRTHQQAEP